MGNKTPLHSLHVALGARLVDFGGWDMPVQYESQLLEHHAVRRQAGVFDVSHMCVLDLHGARVRPFLRHLLANDVNKLTTPGKALYSCMLNETGGVIDDLIVYFLNEQFFRLVVNAGTRAKDLAWIAKHAMPFQVTLKERTDLAMLAVQGPQARSVVAQGLSEATAAQVLALKPFHSIEIDNVFFARTGYTGEDGFEIVLPADAACDFWRELNARGVRSCGLGARDTLRLEAGMNLYGNDMDDGTHPYESALAWTVALEPSERNFVGRAALEAIARAGSARKLVGVLLEERGVLRSHQRVVTAVGEGEMTSGGFAPTLEKSIGFARIPIEAGENLQVDIRGKLLQARVVKLPFVRHGKVLL
jgi:aminomethyltransferase